MQLYAFDESGCISLASQCQRGRNYFCPECKGVVRRRGGLHRQDHFYHVQVSPTCRQSGKTAEHLSVQMYFFKALPAGECYLEYAFPTIHRIADVYWKEKNMAFEVQCSAISAQEAMQRNKDYASLGIEVVWILHDKRYNKLNLSAIEHYLQVKPHYFTNIDAQGVGYIYDQFSLIDGGQRNAILEPLPIDVALVKTYRPHRFLKKALRLVHIRLKARPFHFYGDLVDCYLNGFLSVYFEAALKLEKQFYKESSFPQKLLKVALGVFFRPYKIAFQVLLERCCK